MYEQDETFDSRERKKSRYLSYPYTNMGPGHKGLPVKTEDSETPSHSHQIEGSSVANNRSKRSCTTAKSSTKKLRSKWCRKHIRWSAMSSGREFGKASSSELLSGLYSKALDCNFPCKNRKSDLVEWFFSAFRLSTFRDEAELAAILENRKSGNSGTPVRNDSLSVNGEQKKTKMGQTRKRKNQSLPSQSDMNKDIAASEFLSRCSAKTNNEGLGESMEDVKPAVQLQNVRSTTGVGSSRGKRSLTSKASRPKKTKKLEVCLDDPRSRFCSNSFDGGEKSNKSSSFVIDLQMVPLPRNGSPEKSNGKNKVEVDLTGSNPELYASHIDVGNLDNGFSPKNAPAEHLKTNRATVIPDLNDIGFEDISTQKKLEGDNGFSPELKAKHKQRKDSKPKSELSRSIFSGMEFFQTINYNRIEVNGSCLLLQFDPGVSLPSKDDLLATFCQFGPLNVPETQVSKDVCAQICFLKGADAEKAFRNLKQNRPFGATLVDHNDSSETIAPLKQCEPIAGHSGSKPPHCERPSLEFIRQSLEMMASTLEKKGHTISQQMRDKLEGEIKNLMEKVNSIGSPSMKD
ncbi:serine/threonine-protein kinase ATM-like isoform X1 [Prosopis cineraria]|uniref:serine/threonine-protein kinase ATM-like isoform X1 n=1 Tax=Prosopis cineraria TaxID=364024 RepID=UPI0024100500|nr:serine/threonine-protein kinase ATM-like isoform X1 [Prosopis cineraria]XP_054818477.1 serine/threonine-protein kinase ATM-like isoform X1 [Prosopis cineraria]XP_054818478.1 serine/threonine-protein kinase ATM-like isoform X1 [Prosopis cineraria]XP_054818479.1 serine/threonine-protein kinase ATM-like isoform X1 [Prosopis cineraria]XP_054818480.1 serine/threonine-protein kinase ATM-like isoform X1 [Prosopis cineraria]XP_054818481.1 serine/threonine-protein kinase ATM-like isoform X1 [Prosopi